MENSSVQPKWWNEQTHGSAWEKVKDAMKRDWEQTKKDLHLGGTELHQNVGDTVKQATGKEPIAGTASPNTPATTGLSWDEAEGPLRYGVGARQQFGAEHAAWNDRLESSLRTDWEAAENGVHRKWDDVKGAVRHAYDHGRS